MKIIVAYASAGTGHKNAAQALASYLSMSLGSAVPCLDIVEGSSFFKIIYYRGYDFLVNHLPWYGLRYLQQLTSGYSRHLHSD